MPIEPQELYDPGVLQDIILGERLSETEKAPRFAQADYDEILTAIGSPLIAQTFDGGTIVNTTDFTASTGNNRVYLHALLVPEPVLVTGMAFFLSTLGVYTAASNNKLGLYQIQGTNFVKIAETADNGNLWKTGSANTVRQHAFASSVAVESGIYFAAHLYRNSAQTTNPTTGSRTTLHVDLVSGISAAAPWRVQVLDGQTDLPSSIALASVAANANLRWIALY